MSSYKTEAINLRSLKFSESDKLIHVFTRERGKVPAVAKSARKPTSKYGGRLEILGYNQLLLASGRNLDIITQAETVESFHRVRESESSLNAGLYMAKVLYYFLEERVPNEPLFNLLLGCLRLLKRGEDPATVTRSFDIRLADIEGFLPVERFPHDLRDRIGDIRSGSSSSVLSKEEMSVVDLVLVPGISEHVGRDVSLWKAVQ